MEITFPVYKNEDKDHDYHTIDGLSFLTDDIIGECRWDGTTQVLVPLLADGINWLMFLYSNIVVLTNSSFCPPASKNFQHNCIYLWSWGRTVAQRPDKKNRRVSAVVLAELQWTNTDIPYLSLSTCPGEFDSMTRYPAGRSPESTTNCHFLLH